MHGAKAWQAAKVRFPIGAIVHGSVIRVEAFGVFVALPGCGVPAVLLVTEFEDGPRGFEIDEYPQVGSPVTAVVVDHAEHSPQLRLSTKASRMGAARKGRSPPVGAVVDDASLIAFLADNGLTVADVAVATSDGTEIIVYRDVQGEPRAFLIDDEALATALMAFAKRMGAPAWRP